MRVLIEDFDAMATKVPSHEQRETSTCLAEKMANK